MGLYETLTRQMADSKEESKVEAVEGENMDLLSRLKQIGDQKGVNSPEGKVEPVAETKVETEPQAETSGNTCPTCGKQFKHLAKHKCKAQGAGDKTFLCEEQDVKPEEVVPGPKFVEDVVDKQVEDPIEYAGYMLLLDALVERNGYEKEDVDAVDISHFSEIIRPLTEAVAKENQVPHWGAVDYARGGPLLAAKLAQWLAWAKPSGIILADSQTPELRAVKEVLKQCARVVVQGVR